MLTNARLVYQSRDHDRSMSAALAQASVLCAEKGVRLTATRETVLKLLWQSREPLGAYQLQDQLSRLTGKSIAPPTVYRAIEFLLEQGLVHRIPSLNAFIGCPFPSSHHSNIFMICEHCNNVAEIADPQINQLFEDRCEKLNFKLRTQSFELFGLCPNCASGASNE